MSKRLLAPVLATAILVGTVGLAAPAAQADTTAGQVTRFLKTEWRDAKADDKKYVCDQYKNDAAFMVKMTVDALVDSDWDEPLPARSVLRKVARDFLRWAC